MAIITAEKDKPGDGLLQMVRAKYPGYHPLMAIADLAHETASEALPELRFKCHSAIARYIVPELKSVEVRATIEDRRRVVVSLFGEGEDIEDAVLLEDKTGDSEVLPAMPAVVGEEAILSAIDHELAGMF